MKICVVNKGNIKSTEEINTRNPEKKNKNNKAHENEHE